VDLKHYFVIHSMGHFILTKDFYRQRTVDVAKNLLGKYITIKKNGEVLQRMIIDVEAYDGFKDLASHAARGKTNRNVPMFEDGGVWYVYLIYGMYDMLNIVTGAKDYPAAVLIRGVEGIAGPGKVTKHFGITRAYNGLAAVRKTGLWIEDHGVVVPNHRIQRSARIGVDYAGPVWTEKRYRFFVMP
jgi:DNA-3-methyladenine glycosylase